MSNQYIEDLYKIVKDKYSVETANMGLGDWVCANTVLNGKPFNFDKYPFQKQIMDDMHPNMDVMKISQIGLTEVQVRKSAAFVARNPYINLIFTFPDRTIQKKNSQTRIQPLIEQNQVFNIGNTAETVRSKDLIQIGKSYLFVTAATEGEATSTPADVVMSDEVDLTDQKMLALFQSRMQNSTLRISQRFSTPTFPNYGIDIGFRNSDQHQYLCKCPHCNHWQHPEFNNKFIHIPNLPFLEDLSEITAPLLNNYSVNLSEAKVICESCGKSLELATNNMRSWVAKYPSRVDHRGYQVTPFSTKNLDVKYIVSQLIAYKERMFIRGWYNTVLGLPYAAGNTKLQLPEINAAFSAGSTGVPEISRDTPVYLGCDIGEICHLTLAVDKGGDLAVFLMEQIPSSQLKVRVAELEKRYKLQKGFLDRFPYTTTANEIRDTTKGRILPSEYRGAEIIKLVPLDDRIASKGTSHVQTNRTSQLDELVSRFKSGSIHLSGYNTLKELITNHLQDMVRDEQPEKEAVWVKLTGNDHFFHSLALCNYAHKFANLQDEEEYVSSIILVGSVNLKQSSTLFGGR